LIGSALSRANVRVVQVAAWCYRSRASRYADSAMNKRVFNARDETQVRE